jgi:hypothetical protein
MESNTNGIKTDHSLGAHVPDKFDQCRQGTTEFCWTLQNHLLGLRVRLLDLQTGDVYQLPLAKTNGRGWERWIMCTASFEGADDEFHIDSRLMIVRCGMNYSERLRKNVPDTYYFLWEADHFRQLVYISGKP